MKNLMLVLSVIVLSACSGGGGGGGGGTPNPPDDGTPTYTYSATYSQYLPAQADTVACSGTVATSRTVVSCIRVEDNATVDPSLCVDPNPTSTVLSKAETRVKSSPTNPSLSNGVEQESCATGATAWTSQITCDSGYHVEGATLATQDCVADARSCYIANGSGGQSWNSSTSTWNSCQVLTCNATYYSTGTSCEQNSRTCSPLPANTTAGTQTTSDGGLTWGACTATACSAGYSVQGGTCVADGGGSTGTGSLVYKDESVFQIRNDGSLYVWGSNDRGQLGVGDTVNKTSPIKVNLGVGRTAKKVVSNGYSTCSILDNNDLKCWGEGMYYQLGRGDTASQTSPEVGALLSNVKDIVKGVNGYCAILNDNSLTCWGQNRNGSFGVGNNSAVQTPTTVPLSGRTVKKLVMSDGSDHGTSCAILDDNSLRCWGYNGQGQSGVGSVVDTEKLFPQFVNLGASRTAKDIYVFRNSGETQSSVCSILDDDSLKCWGKNTNAKLGVGHSTETVSSPSVVNVGAGVGVKSLYNNESGAMCALLSTDRMACWGKNNIAQVGTTNGGGADVVSPYTHFSGNPGFIKEIVLGYGNANYAIGLSGAVLAWGSNDRGQLGTGDTSNKSVPTTITLSGNVKKVISTSPYTTCAILTNNSLECTGDNTLGTVGAGTVAGLYSSFTSVNLGGLSVSDIKMGDYWAGVLLSDDTVSTWGAALKGKLGNGTSTPNVNLPQLLVYP